MAPTEPCDVCGIHSTKTCAKCKAAFYCSVDHQKMFWKYHKLNCGLENNNFSFFPMPDFQESEAFNTVAALSTSFPNDKTLKHLRATVKVEPKRALATLVSTFFPKNNATARTQIITGLRYTIYGLEDLQDPGGHPIEPYYKLAAIQSTIDNGEGVIEFSYQFIRQFFNYLTLYCLAKGFIVKSNEDEFFNIVDFMETSNERLGKILKELEITTQLNKEENIYKFYYDRCVMELDGLREYMHNPNSRTSKEHSAMLEKYAESAVERNKIWFKME